jgi:hypothetical protein
MAVLTLRRVDLSSGETIPVLGQGTWHLGQGHTLVPGNFRRYASGST